MNKKIELTGVVAYPCQFNDLIDCDRFTRITVSTLKDAIKENLFFKEGFYFNKEDLIWDIIIEKPYLTKIVVKEYLKILSAKVSCEFKLS